MQKHGLGAFTGEGYRFWKPQALGGWAMAYGSTQAVAIVFGKKCGVLDEEVDPAIERAAKFFGYFVDKGDDPLWRARAVAVP